jgi:hypothetical protein
MGNMNYITGDVYSYRAVLLGHKPHVASYEEQTVLLIPSVTTDIHPRYLSCLTSVYPKVSGRVNNEIYAYYNKHNNKGLWRQNSLD